MGLAGTGVIGLGVAGEAALSPGAGGGFSDGSLIIDNTRPNSPSWAWAMLCGLPAWILRNTLSSSGSGRPASGSGGSPRGGRSLVFLLLLLSLPPSLLSAVFTGSGGGAMSGKLFLVMYSLMPFQPLYT